MHHLSRSLSIFGAAGALVAGLLVAAVNPSAAAPDIGTPAGGGPAVRADDNGRSTVVFEPGRYLTGPSEQSAAETALGYLRDHRGLFRLSTAAADTFEVTKDVVTAHDGVHHLVIGQRVDGLPVDGATITAVVDGQGRLVLIGGTSGEPETSGSAELTAGDAIQAAAAEAGVDDPAAPRRSQTTSPGEHSFRNRYADVVDPNRLSAQLVWALEADRSLRLAWRTEVEASSTSWYTSLVDAETGALLEHESRYAHSGPEGNVITGQHHDADPTQAITPFPAGWLGASTTTSGNNVNAYLDRTNTNANDEYQPTAADQHFNYTFTDAWRTTADENSAAALDADRDAIITQLFYYTNDMHDWLYARGFDEASGNFQVDNFGLGGVGGDPVLAEAQDGYNFGCDDGDGTPNESPDDRCRNNANFGTGADGTTPRMQMYMWIPGRPFRDGSMDGDVIAHEVGHGVERRLVPGGINLGGVGQADSLGEGWSDTISFLRWGDATVGEYVTGNANGGIRSANYDVHTGTYSDYNPAAGSPHPNGEIWAATMYDVREGLGLSNATIELILDGMRNTPDGPAPSFLDARDGLMAADLATNGGANRCELLSIFAARGMGTNAVDAGQNAAQVDDFTVPPECLPTADAGGPYNTNEGTDAALDGTASAGGTDPTAAALTTYEWDLDNDSQYDDATGATPSFTDVGQDGVFTVGLRVTDEFSNTDTDTSTVTVANVAPTVTIDPITGIDEFGTATITGTVTDPGWEEALTATIDFDDGNGAQPLAGTLENTRPDATLTFSVPHQYGDNGIYTVSVVGEDDDTGDTDTEDVAVGNIDPTSTIDTSGEQIYDGVTAFILEAGEDLTVPASSEDPGSDDLTFTWDWGDGSSDSETSLVNPPATDPAKSPTVQPRDVTLESTHAYGDACLFDLGVGVEDDDGGSATDTATVLVTGNATVSRGHGWWLNQYRVKKANDFTPAELQCYLDIVNYLSLVFSEEKDADSRADATSVLNIPAKSPADVVFDQHALGAWLNFANGSVKLDTPVDTNNDGVDDSTFGAVMLVAETVRINPASTSAQVKAQKDIVERIATQSD